MYFYNQGKKQVVDFTGNLILTHNAELITARFPSAAPKGGAKHAKYVLVGKLSFFGKCMTVWHAAKFIFGKSTALIQPGA